MSVPTRRALYGKLAADSTLTNLLGSAAPGYTKAIYYEQAPADASGYPYVVFNKQAGTPTYAFGSTALNEEVWLFKAVDRSEDADAVDGIRTRLSDLLTDGAISISGRTQLYLRREADVDYAEDVDGNRYLHAGATFRLVYE